MSTEAAPAMLPNRSAWRTRSATLALQISFLLGRQLVFGQEPPINLRSTTAERCPDLAMCQARYLPPSPLPRTSISKCSGWDIFDSSSFKSKRHADENLGPPQQVVRRTDPQRPPGRSASKRPTLSPFSELTANRLEFC